ncbi:hypothetical protein K1719_009353 [Acacia pycnantha]|nr:hypothetical protein K1719_009353 [Acacia pycnantha]
MPSPPPPLPPVTMSDHFPALEQQLLLSHASLYSPLRCLHQRFRFRPFSPRRRRPQTRSCLCLLNYKASSSSSVGREGRDAVDGASLRLQVRRAWTEWVGERCDIEMKRSMGRRGSGARGEREERRFG